MNTEINKITEIANDMCLYQKFKNIKAECVTNTQILFDIINDNYPHLDVKAKPCFVIEINKDKKYIKTIVHTLIEVNKTIIDPSYETNSLKNTLYMDSLNEVKEYLGDLYKDNCKYLVSKFISLNNLSNKINSKKYTVRNDEYYNNVYDFLEMNRMMKKILFN
jgi:hypothetical protein